MDNELNISVETQEVAEPVISEQTTETTGQTVNADNAEVTTAQVDEKQVQSKEENANYANIRREYEAKIATESQKAIDAEYSRLYGESHNIHSKSDYDKAVIKASEEARQESLREQGIDPEIVNEYVKNSPAMKEANTVLEQQRQQRYLGEQVKALEEYAPGIDLSKLDPMVVKEFESGKPLVDAYAKWENASLKAKIAEYEKGSKTQEINLKNALTSTGSTVGNGVTPNDFIAKEVFEANKGNRDWLSKNYDLLTNSMNKWK